MSDSSWGMGGIIEIGRSFRAEVRKKKKGQTLTLYETFARRKAACALLALRLHPDYGQTDLATI